MLSRYIEELTLNAWPALNNLMFDGWVLSFSEGYTRRANSIHPLYSSTVPLGDKISACEAAYAARGQETVFKLTSAGTQDAALDVALERRGYGLAGMTSVQIADLSRLAPALDPSITIGTSLDDAWLDVLNRLSATPERFHTTMRSMLTRIAPAHAFASMAMDGRIVAQGLAVAERGYVGLFDIIVDPEVRNQGHGRRLVTSLLAWGREQGASQAHLSVIVDNDPALRLYARLGFEESYRYWYRHKRRD